MDTKDTKNLDSKLAAAKAKKAEREKAGNVTQTVPGGTTEAGATVPTKKEKELSDEAKQIAEIKAAAKAKKEAERAAKKAADEAAKAERKAARETEKATKAAAKAADKANHKPHTAKLDRAAAKLPGLTDDEQLIVDDLLANKGINISNIAQVLAFRSRQHATETALTVNLVAGQTVRIVGGGGQGGVDPRYIGKVGTMHKVQRIRGYVTIPGVKNPVYGFLSEFTPVAAEELATDEAPAGDEAQAAAA